MITVFCLFMRFLAILEELKSFLYLLLFFACFYAQDFLLILYWTFVRNVICFFTRIIVTDNFKNVIERAKEGWNNSKVPIDRRFADVKKILKVGVCAKRNKWYNACCNFKKFIWMIFNLIKSK